LIAAAVLAGKAFSFFPPPPAVILKNYFSRSEAGGTAGRQALTRTKPDGLLPTAAL
jgi:hypothetical protein